MEHLKNAGHRCVPSGCGRRRGRRRAVRVAPGQFTAARNARAREAKAAGDKETAARIAVLRKPTVLAWLVNLLVRELPDEIGGFLDLGDALREATATLSGPELRQLSGQRHRLVQALVRQARDLARQAGYRITEDVARAWRKPCRRP